MTVEAQIIAILAEQAVLDPAMISADMTLADLGIDSVALVESIFAIEETFDISVPFNANAPSDNDFDISTVRSMIAAVEKLVAAKA